MSQVVSVRLSDQVADELRKRVADGSLASATSHVETLLRRDFGLVLPPTVRAIDVACPACKAQPGQPCKNAISFSAGGFHGRRNTAALATISPTTDTTTVEI